MISLIIVVFILFIIYNLSHYEALAFAWKEKGFMGVVSMSFAVFIRDLAGLFIKD